MKLLKLIPEFILWAFVFLTNQPVSSQSNLLLKMKLQSDKSVSIGTISKITFNAGNMIVRTNNQVSETYTLLDISKIIFDTNSAVNELTTQYGELSVYPNPTKNTLYLKGFEGGLITIYRIDGVLVSQFQSNNSENGIDVSALNEGVYLVKIAGRTAKFVKL